MGADVNVTEKVARAFAASDGLNPDAPSKSGLGEPAWTDYAPEANAALSALADPEVLAGIAGVLREALNEWAGMLPSEVPEVYDSLHDWMHAHQAAAVVEWLRGRRP